MSAGIRLLSSVLVAVGLLLLAIACNDEYDLSSSDTSVNAPNQNKDQVPQWLESHHEISAADWLIIRSPAALKGDVTDKQHRVAILQDASEHFRENPRMIANRATQLEDMLLEIDIEESAVSLIDQFTHLPTRGTPHNFSAYCQYYFNLRAQGYDEHYALAELSKLK
ncbi:hypothetical protein LP43_1830 [Methylophaga thiooxydans]|uniref:MxaH protein n=2 Tax=Methylophaga thiooxydans TaxID=392484 RepID=C0NA14_9GAMM|nr:hypothetical protein [Methylophaga thiooxydans]EEF78425.1 hypothetical protein MDMS009_2969 [Methylophaga thiooxydans DMS010]KGM06606.1 hypothetical protein LP43_1830 [Methylophaga thiooxydans]